MDLPPDNRLVFVSTGTDGHIKHHLYFDSMKPAMQAAQFVSLNNFAST